MSSAMEATCRAALTQVVLVLRVRGEMIHRASVRAKFRCRTTRLSQTATSRSRRVRVSALIDLAAIRPATPIISNGEEADPC